MGIWRKLVRRYWYQPAGAYNVAKGTVPAARSGRLRAILWRYEGKQDPVTGEIIGQRDRLARRVCLAIRAHWLAHWKFWISAGIAAATAGAAIAGLLAQLQIALVQSEPKSAEVHCHCDGKDEHQPIVVIPLRSD